MLNLVASFGVLCACPGQQTNMHTTDLKAFLLEKAPRAWEKYDFRAKRLQGSWGHFGIDDVTKKQFRRSTYVSKQREDCFSISEKWIDQEGIEKEDVFVQNPQYKFFLRRQKKQGSWSSWLLKDVGKKVWKPASPEDPAYF